MEATSSLTQGCFLHNATSFKSQSILTGSFQSLPGEGAGDALIRAEVNCQLWTAAKEIIEEISGSCHGQLLSSVIEFVRESSEQLKRLSVGGCSAEEEGEARVSPPQRLEIPTAVVAAGVNMPDHEVLFRELRSKIAASVTPHVVQLHSETCSAGIKAAWKEILMQVTRSSENESLELEEGEEGEGEVSRPNLSLPSLSLLQRWYLDTHQTSGPPLVVIVEDYEGFPPLILHDIIMSISPHLGTLPVVLIVGVATSAAAIHSLPHSSSCLLCVEQFSAPSSIATLNLLIEKVLLSPALPVKLGHQTLQFLLSQFLCSSLSVSQFSRTLQMSMMEHFHWQPLSFLIGKWDDPDSRIRALKHDQCEMIRATPSFRRYVDNLNDPEEQIRLLTEDKCLKELAVDQLKELRIHQQTFPPLLQCLHTLTESLPTAPLGRKLHDVYLLCMERLIVEQGNFGTAWNLLKMTGRDTLTGAVWKCIAILSDSHSKNQRDTGCILARTLQVFKSFLSDLEQIDREAQEKREVKDGGLGPLAGELLTTSERKMMLQERLRQVASRKKEPSAFERTRTSLLDNLLPCLKEGLVPPHMLPLHEICYFNNASSLRKHLSPAPRASLHIALTKPSFYLPSAANVSEQGSLSPTMPDVCIVYLLHLECGRLINLFDWLCSFVAVVDPAAAEKLAIQEGGKGRKEDVDPKLQSRFIQAVSELQLLGFVKHTQRKTDHVQRLTWGAC